MPQTVARYYAGLSLVERFFVRCVWSSQLIGMMPESQWTINEPQPKQWLVTEHLEGSKVNISPFLLVERPDGLLEMTSVRYKQTLTVDPVAARDWRVPVFILAYAGTRRIH